MRDALRVIARLLGANDPEAVAWHRLDFSKTSAIQAQLVAERNPDAAKKCVSAMRGVLNACVQLEQMSIEAFARATRLSKIRGSLIRKKVVLREGDVEKLLAATRSDSKRMRAMRDRAMVGLLAGGGLRRAEAAYVTTDHFDRATRVLRVLGKGRKERPIPLPEWAARVITEFVDARGFSGPILCRVSQRGEALREPLSGGQATYVVARRLWRRAGLSPLGCHAFRRHFCVSVVEGGADIFATQQLMGHSDPKTTAGYAERRIEKLAAATDRLADPEARNG